MTLYLLYMISPFLLAVVRNLFTHKTVKNDKIYLYIMCCIMTFFLAFRSYNVGSSDSYFYYNLWTRLQAIDLQTALSIDLEYGFLISVWALSRIFRDGQFFFIITSLLFGFSTYKFLKENSEDYLIGFLLFNGFGLFSFYLQGIRQAISISICLLSVKYIKDRKPIHFFALILLAMQFHASAAVFAIAYFVPSIRIGFKSIVLTILIIISAPYILNQITNLANILMNESYIGGSIESTHGGVPTMIMFVMIIALGLLLYNRNNETIDMGAITVNDINSLSINYFYSFYFFMFLIGVGFFSTRFFYISVFERASYYFTLFSIPLLELSIKNLASKSRYFARYILLFILLLLVIYKSGPSSSVYNYHFFWQGINC